MHHGLPGGGGAGLPASVISKYRQIADRPGPDVDHRWVGPVTTGELTHWKTTDGRMPYSNYL